MAAKEKKEKPKKEKRARERLAPKEFNALILGICSIVLAAFGMILLFLISGVAGAVLGGCAVIVGLISLFFGKKGALPAVVGLIAGFLTVLSYIATVALG